MSLILSLFTVVFLLTPSGSQPCTLPDSSVILQVDDQPCEALPCCDLTASLITAGAAGQALILLPLSVDFPFRLSSISISTNVTISGQGSVLQLSGVVKVQSSGVLTMVNIRLESSNAAGRIKTSGTLAAVGLVVRGWAAVTIEVSGGVVTLTDSQFVGNKRVSLLLIAWDSLEIANVEFTENSGGFVTTPADNQACGRITVQRSTFRGNDGWPLIRVFSRNKGEAGVLLVTDCSVERNSAPLFDLNIDNVLWHLNSTTFLNNTAPGVSLSQRSSSGLVTSCLWISNSGPLLLLTSLQGQVTLSACEVAQQMHIAAIQIQNTGETALCLVNVSQFLFRDSEIRPATVSAGAVFSYNCSLSLSTTLIRNVTVIAPSFEQAYGVLVACRSFLSIENTSMRSTGGTGTAVFSLLSTLYVRNATIVDTKTGSEGVIIAIGSQVAMHGLVLGGGELFSTIVFKANTKRFAYIAAEMTTLELHNLTYRDQPKYFSAMILGMFSSISCSDFALSDIFGYTVFYLLSARVVLTASSCSRCKLVFFAEGAGNSSVYISSAEFSDSLIAAAVVMAGGGGDIVLQGFHLRNVTGEGLVTNEYGHVVATDIEVDNCAIATMLSFLVQAHAELRHLRCWGHSGGLVSSGGSSVYISDAQFEHMQKGGTLIYVSASEIFIEKTVIRMAVSGTFAYAIQQSSLRFSDVTVLEARALAGVLISASESSVAITGSLFQRFNCTLVSVTGSSVLIQSSTFEHGGVRDFGTAEAKGFLGGVVRCTDCTSLSLDAVEVRNVSAVVGGAVSAQASDGTPSIVSIRNSSFSDCVAISGGAVWVRNVSLTVRQSSFRNCSAELYGGGLCVRGSQTCEISASSFAENTAVEGGGVKWTDCQPDISDLSFLNNSAVYGPDIASNGVALVLRIDEKIAPGQSVTIGFDLIDHYGQVATTAVGHFLSLISTDNLTFKGITSKAVVSGAANFTNIQLFATPASVQAMIVHYVSQQSIVFKSYTSVSVRDCVPGELKTANSCTVCPASYFSLSPTETECRQCPAMADCPGGAVVVPKEGAWASNHTETPVVACPVFKDCKGTADNLCKDGHSGRLCSECAPGWFRLVFSGCWQCSSPSFLLFVEPLLSLVCFFCFLYGVLLFGHIRPSSERLHALKVFVTHIQILGLLSYVRVAYPAALDVYLHTMVAAASVSTVAFALQCEGVGYYRVVTVGSGCGFVLTAAMLVFVWVRWMCVRKWSICRGELQLLSIAVSWTLPAASAFSMLPLMSCDSRIDGVQRLAGDLSQECWAGEHLKSVWREAVPALIVNGLVSVVVFARCFLIKSVCAGMSSDLTTAHWELSFLFGKMLCFSAVLLQLSFPSSSQVYAGLLVLYTILVVNGLTPVYRSTFLLFLSQGSYFVLAGTYSLLLAYLEYTEPPWDSLFAGAVIAINTGFLALCLWYVVRGRKIARRQMYVIAERAEDVASFGELIAPNNSGLALSAVEVNISVSDELK